MGHEINIVGHNQNLKKCKKNRKYQRIIQVIKVSTVCSLAETGSLVLRVQCSSYLGAVKNFRGEGIAQVVD